MHNTHSVSDDQIARRAYEIWQARGCPQGDGSADWLAAKEELLATRVSRNGTTQQRVQTWWHRVRERIAAAMESSA
jgi:hypothetical protein